MRILKASSGRTWRMIWFQAEYSLARYQAARTSIATLDMRALETVAFNAALGYRSPTQFLENWLTEQQQEKLVA